MKLEEVKISENLYLRYNDLEGFVGIELESGVATVSFPIGFDNFDENKKIYDEIILLINTLYKYENKLPGGLHDDSSIINDLPIQSYLYVITNFLEKGLYYTRDITYSTNTGGKINWPRTIKNGFPYLNQNNQLIYLEHIKSNSVINENSIITKIHKYCIVESINKIGWLFPDLKVEYYTNVSETRSNEYLTELIHVFQNTHKDDDKILFLHMIYVLMFLSKNQSVSALRLGTFRFEYIWEQLIDETFGVLNKTNYFPNTHWVTNKGETIKNSNLIPDSIMKLSSKIFVIDAKYYRYGVTKNPIHLPGTSDIHKQITYGEYIKKENDNFKVYNVFLLPYSSKNNECLEYVGHSESNWKNNKFKYERVHGVLIDTKTLMRLQMNKDRLKNELSDLLTTNK